MLRALSAAWLLALSLAGSAAAAAVPRSTSGINDAHCVASPDKPPIVFLHGLPAPPALNFLTKAPLFAARGHCVFTPSYGITAGVVFAGAHVADSAAEVSAHVSSILASTGAPKAILVGHSMGTLVAAYYLKHLGGNTAVSAYVGFGGVYNGTTAAGLAALKAAAGITELWCPGCLEAVRPSAVIDGLWEGGIVAEGPTYTVIVTKLDANVLPYTSGIIEEDGVVNVVLQDECPSDLAGHVGMTVDPNVSGWIQWAIDGRQGPKPKCVPFVVPL
jgi:triacylglycerol esterase/lipase EstA (alpha/beta hydrolase family)